MFFTLLVVTFVLSLLVSVILVRVFSQPVERILKRIIADAIHDAWLKYLKFAICVVGVSSGVRIHEIERYFTPARYSRKNAGSENCRADNRALGAGGLPQHHRNTAGDRLAAAGVFCVCADCLCGGAGV